MCREAKLEPLDTIMGCVANLKSVLVNIVDYIDAKRNGKPIKVWPPHEFEAFKSYTLSPNKRIDQAVAREGDGFLAVLLQILRPYNAAVQYQGRRYRAAMAREYCSSRVSSNVGDVKTEAQLAVVKEEPGTPCGSNKQECEVISIHGTDSDVSSPPRTVDYDVVQTLPIDSSTSVASPVVQIPSIGQTGIKRGCDLDLGSDVPEDGCTLPSVHKRPRVETTIHNTVI
jgi:hypothetical protein